jgi:hypothetical protein
MSSRWCAALGVMLCCSAALGAEIGFTEQPKAMKDGAAYRVTFAVSAPTDVEVAVLNGAGAVVRHLSAGALAPKAGAHSVTWDGRDDRGQPAAGAPFSFRIRLGVKPTFERIVGWNGNTLGGALVGLAVGRQGEVYVLLSDGTWGRSELRVLDKDGRYLRTIIPYPSSTPKERAASLGQLEVGGQRLPIIYSGHGHNLAPLTCGMKNQNMAVSPKGYLVLASGVGTIADHAPPRHLLAVHPEGGAPAGMNFVGPEIRKPIGFLGGSGEGFSRAFDHLAFSPDGEHLYFTQYIVSNRFKQRHGVFRITWSDQGLGQPFLGADEPGADDDHFSDPQGVATDGKGNIYVCDRGNGRVVVFSAAAKRLGQFAVAAPEQVGVHARTGDIYIASNAVDKNGRHTGQGEIVKFPAWSGGDLKPVACLAVKGLDVMALDAQSSPAKVWVACADGLLPIADKGSALEPGTAVNNNDGLKYPGFIAVDPKRSAVLVREMTTGRTQKALRRIDLATGVKAPFLNGADMAIDRDGNIYVMDGYSTNAVSRYDPTGAPLPFTPGGSHTLKIGTYRAYGPDMGLRGMCIAPSGDLYVLRSNNFNYGGVNGDGMEGVVDVFGPDGTARKTGIIAGLGRGDCGLGVDAAGNVYVGANLKPKDQPVPADFADQVPLKGWAWWRTRRNPPWYYTYYNPYLYHWGSVFKFGPSGGQLYGFGGPPTPSASNPKPPVSPLTDLKNAPAGEGVSYWSGYVSREVKVVGALWRYAGFGIVPASTDTDVGTGDPHCVCLTSHLAVDPYGRVFVPDVFRFCVEMVDANGNFIGRFGQYGNADEGRAGPPTLSFAWPAFVAAAEDHLYISDSVNRRVTVIRLNFAAEARARIE